MVCRAAFIAALLIWPAPSLASEKVTELDRFRLWNECRPFSLVIERLSQSATKMGLSNNSIAAATRSRLRAARLYTPDQTSPEWLYVNINVVGKAHNISLQFKKTVKDLSSGRSNYATTWGTGITGTHGMSGADYIMSGLSEGMDRFIDNFLRINASACVSQPRRLTK